MKHWCDSRERMVAESLQGLVASSGGRLVRLDDSLRLQVVLRAERDPQKVALISGGGSGHEPAHAGFVGQGMLTAAVCGEIFASPSVDAILTTLRAVCGPAGALLIVKNYTGDRLNFGLAAERARQLGLSVEMVVVSDDASLAATAHPRGIAGTLLVHKVAGHYAEQGHDLATVAARAAEVAEATRTLGLALSLCRPPGQEDKEGLPGGQGELGLGIHGEPGVQRVPLAGAPAMVELVTERLAPWVGDGPVVALVNNLGSVPPLEMNLLVHHYLQTPLGQRTELMVGPSQLMTSYDMNGFSLSVLPLNESLRQALRSPVEVPAWPGASSVFRGPTVPLPATEREPASASDNPRVRQRLATVAEALLAARADLNRLDTGVGDGDAGDTLGAAATAVREHLDRLPLAQPAALLAALSQLLDGVGGSSGVLLAILCSAASQEYARRPDWPGALSHGLERMMVYGGAGLGDRTMVDVLHPVLTRWEQGASLAELAVLGRQAAERTASLSSARAGRSAYLSQTDLQGRPDPGAEAVARVLEALAQSESGQPV